MYGMGQLMAGQPQGQPQMPPQGLAGAMAPQGAPQQPRQGLMQMLQSLPPQVMQQLMAMLGRK